MDQRHVEISGDGTNSLQDLIIWNFISNVYTPEGIYNTIVGHDFINRISWYEVLPNSWYIIAPKVHNGRSIIHEENLLT